jgi:hypothetical protein
MAMKGGELVHPCAFVKAIRTIDNDGGMRRKSFEDVCTMPPRPQVEGSWLVDQRDPGEGNDAHDRRFLKVAKPIRTGAETAGSTERRKRRERMLLPSIRVCFVILLSSFSEARRNLKGFPFQCRETGSPLTLQPRPPSSATAPMLFAHAGMYVPSR